jgi:hypothetical protein
MQKQYTRPYCALILDGFDENSEITADNQDNTDNTNVQESRISIITSAECHFVASNQRLSGGRAFIENLASAVSSYAQELLSGLSHPQNNQTDYPQIQITQATSSGRHHLTLESDPKIDQPKQEIALKTVELFDLVEVIDRFYADTTTLPDVSLKLEVVGKRFRQPEEPLAQRVIPLVTGTVGLAIAAGIFFVLPLPEVRQLEPNSETVPTQPIPNAPENTPVEPSN